MRTALTLITIALLSTPFAVQPTLAVDASISAKCSPDAPEGYKRPGGYCDQIGATSLISGEKSDCTGNCAILANDGPEDQ